LGKIVKLNVAKNINIFCATTYYKKLQGTSKNSPIANIPQSGHPVNDIFTLEIKMMTIIFYSGSFFSSHVAGEEINST
jgi:hypothetical protein